MTCFRPTPVRDRADLIGRAFWAALAGIHVPPLMKVGEAALAGGLPVERAIGGIALVLTLAFFAAKVAGVRFVPVHCRRTAVLAFLIACGMLHGNISTEQWLSKAGAGALAVSVTAGGGAGSELLRRVRRKLHSAGEALAEFLDRLGAGLTQVWLPVRIALADDRPLVSVLGVAVGGSVSARAPPA